MSLPRQVEECSEKECSDCALLPCVPHSPLRSLASGSANPSEAKAVGTREAVIRRISWSEIHQSLYCTVLPEIFANKMVVKIRLARFGRRKAPFYNIVVSHARFVKSPTKDRRRVY